MVHYCKISDGKMSFPSKDGNKLFIDDLKKFEGKDVEITIKKTVKTHSINQERYFHLLVNLLAKEQGYEPEELKDNIKQMFGFCENKINPITKETYSILRSSKYFTDEEYSYLISCTLDWIRSFYPDFVIPDPFIFNLKKSDYERK